MQKNTRYKVKVTLLVMALLLLVISPDLGKIYATPYTPTADIIGTTTAALPFRFTYQKKGFYAADRWWVFYGTTIAYYTSSADGDTWLAGTSIGSVENAGGFSVWWDGTYVHYTRSDADASDNFYRMGTPISDGSITWAAAEQTVFSGAAHYCHYPTVTVDSDGYPWILYNSLDGGLANGKPKIHKSTTKDGTWTEDAGNGFPYNPCARDTEHYGLVVPMLSGKMMAVYKGDPLNGDPIYTRLWTGSAWQGENSTFSLVYNELFSAIAVGDTVHIIARDNTQINATQWTGSSWSAESLVSSHGDLATPCVGKDSDGNLYVFFTGGWTKQIHRAIYDGSWNAETTYYSSPHDIKYGYAVSCYYEYENDDKFAVLFPKKTASPYDMVILMEEAPTGEISATLNTPANAYSTTNPVMTFNFTPIWTESQAPMHNASFHISDVSYATHHWNTTTLVNNTINTISYTVVNRGTFTWSVQVFNSTHSVYSSTRSLTIKSSQPFIPPIITPTYVNATWYMRSDTHTIHDLLAYRLRTVQSATETIDTRSSAGDLSVSWGIRIWVLDADSTEYEITGGSPVAVVTRVADGEGLQSTTWTCPEYHFVVDAIRIRVYQRYDSGTWSLRAIFCSNDELLYRLTNTDWTLNYFTNRTFVGGSTYANFSYGDLSHLSSVSFYYDHVSPWEEMMYWLYKGEFLTFIATPWTYNIGSLFYGLLVMFFSVTTYNRYQSARAVLVIAWLFGGAGSVLSLLMPAIGLNISWLILAFALAVTLYKLFR